MIKKELSLRMGENVRQCRKDKGYTQEDLAEACNFSAAFCAQVETGSRMMSLPTLVKVSEVLHTTPNILIYGKTKNERIAHIVSMLDDMSESEISYIEKWSVATATSPVSVFSASMSVAVWAFVSMW